MPRNAKIEKYPAYKEDIKNNTFVSVVAEQYGREEIVLNDTSILGTVDYVVFMRSFELPSNKWLYVWVNSEVDRGTSGYRDVQICARIITRNSNGTYTLGSIVELLSGSYTGGSGGSVDYWVERGENNTFVGHLLANNGKAVIFVFQVSGNTISIKKTIERNEPSMSSVAPTKGDDRLVTAGYAGHDNLFLIYGNYNDGSFSVKSYEAVFIYKLNSDFTFTRTAVAFSASMTSTLYERYVPLGYVGGYTVCYTVGYSFLALLDITSSKATVVKTLDSNYNYQDRPAMSHLRNNLYAIYGSRDTSYFRTEVIDISGTNLTRKAIYINDAYGADIDVFPEQLLWSPDINVLFITYTGQWTAVQVKAFEINTTSFTITPWKNKDWNCVAPGGAWLVDDYIFEGIALDSRDSDQTAHGIGRWNWNTDRSCIRNSLDTKAITGITLQTCTYDKPGKVAILNDSATIVEAYGLLEPIVVTIKDDSVQEVQDELNK